MDEQSIADDGLPIPTVGPWSKQKYHFLDRYLNIFATGMKNKWPERHYIDLFAGAGYSKIKSTGEILLSSSLLAATVIDNFTCLHICDRDPGNTHAIKERINRHAPEQGCHIHTGDANDLIEQILQKVPRQRSLSIAFVDPFGLHFDFDTLKLLASRHSDLIILFADKMDALRNWAAYYKDNPESNLDRFMGEPGWRKALANSPGDKLAEKLRKSYIEQLKTIGYNYFDTKPIKNTKGIYI